jgi:hypothetical protein
MCVERLQLLLRGVQPSRQWVVAICTAHCCLFSLSLIHEHRAWASQPWPLCSASTQQHTTSSCTESGSKQDKWAQVCRCRPSTRGHCSQRSSGPSLCVCVCVCPAVCAKMCAQVCTLHTRFQQKFGFTSIAPLNRQEYKTEAPPWETPLGTLEGDLCKRTLTSVLARPLTRATLLSERVAPCMHAS